MERMMALSHAFDHRKHGTRKNAVPPSMVRHDVHISTTSSAVSCEPELTVISSAVLHGRDASIALPFGKQREGAASHSRQKLEENVLPSYFKPLGAQNLPPPQ
jgi:hypothetical protein